MQETTSFTKNLVDNNTQSELSRHHNDENSVFFSGTRMIRPGVAPLETSDVNKLLENRLENSKRTHYEEEIENFETL